MRSAWSSWVPWLKLRRNTSAPAWKSRASTSGVEVAGPSVATILVRRRRRSLMRGAIGRSGSDRSVVDARGSMANRHRRAM